MGKLLIFIMVLFLSGCYRDTPALQAEDYKICLGAGMTAYLSALHEIKCIPYGSSVDTGVLHDTEEGAMTR